MARSRGKTTRRHVRKTRVTRWSLSSLGIITLVLLLALMWLLVLLHNAAEDQLQRFSVSQDRMLEQLSADMDTIDVSVLEAQTQLLDEE